MKTQLNPTHWPTTAYRGVCGQEVARIRATIGRGRGVTEGVGSVGSLDCPRVRPTNPRAA